MSALVVPSSEAKDPAGVTPAQREQYLVNAHDYVLQVCSNESSSRWQRVQVQRMFLLRCVATILHAEGRAVFLHDLEDAREHAIGSDPSDPNRVSFSADGATYEFYRGEFPDYDKALEHLMSDGAGLHDPTSELEYQGLYQRALATFQEQKKEEPK